MLTDKLLQAGFDRVLVLSGEDCGVPEAARVVIALWTYEAEACPATEEAWIHPYYDASQRAYRAASDIVKEEPGARLRDDLRVKPIFARLPVFRQGRNTLSYAEDIGSRFHVQILATDEQLPITDVLEEAPHALSCGRCRLCLDACPTEAIDEEGFHRERCLRNWMLSGKPVPEEVRGMGNRLIGCDECQRCCPMNPQPTGEARPTVPLIKLLTQPREMADALRGRIGANLALPNRLLSQACLIAGCSAKTDLLPILRELTAHPSPTVREHAAWAVRQLASKDAPGS